MGRDNEPALLSSSVLFLPLSFFCYRDQGRRRGRQNKRRKTKMATSSSRHETRRKKSKEGKGGRMTGMQGRIDQGKATGEGEQGRTQAHRSTPRGGKREKKPLLGRETKDKKGV